MLGVPPVIASLIVSLKESAMAGAPTPNAVAMKAGNARRTKAPSGIRKVIFADVIILSPGSYISASVCGRGDTQSTCIRDESPLTHRCRGGQAFETLGTASPLRPSRRQQ